MYQAKLSFSANIFHISSDFYQERVVGEENMSNKWRKVVDKPALIALDHKLVVGQLFVGMKTSLVCEGSWGLFHSSFG